MDYNRLDIVLKTVAENSPVSRHKLNGNVEKYVDKEIRTLKNIGYVIADEVMGTEISITPDGLKYFLEGGFSGHMRKNEIMHQALYYQTKWNKWLYGTKWLPLILSMISIAISIYTLCKC
jgi:hypothetical protein